MTEDQIKKVMRLVDEIADYSWKQGVSDGSYSQADHDRKCCDDSRAELEAYLRTIGEPAGYAFPPNSTGAKKFAQFGGGFTPVGLVFSKGESAMAISEHGRVYWDRNLVHPISGKPESVNAELMEAAKITVRDALDRVDVHPCDENNDAVKAKGLFGSMRELHLAIARAESAIENPAKVSPTTSVPAALLKPHVFRELVNDLRDLAMQYHGHDSLRERISGRLGLDVPVVGPCGGHAAQLPDPLGLLSCTHPDCGRYEGPRSHECRAMADNACARPSICQVHAVQQDADASRDWPEDFPHENGQYMNTCYLCKNTFIGHKRRVVCKVCSDRLPKPAKQDRRKKGGTT